MTDTTSFVTTLPVSEAFPSSILQMGGDSAALAETAVQAAGAGEVWMHILTILSIILVVSSLRNLHFIAIPLLDCLWRWRGNFILESSIPYQNARNRSAIFLTLPFLLTIYRFQLPGVELMLLYAAARLLLYLLLLGTARRSRNEYRQAGICVLNYFIPLVVLMLCTIGVLLVFNCPDTSARRVLYIEMGLIYLLFLIRKTEIFLGSFSPLRVFLYLCGLEIVPTGLLVTAAVAL